MFLAGNPWMKEWVVLTWFQYRVEWNKVWQNVAFLYLGGAFTAGEYLCSSMLQAAGSRAHGPFLCSQDILTPPPAMFTSITQSLVRGVLMSLRLQGWALENVVVPVARSYGMEEEYQYLRPSIKRFPTGVFCTVVLWTYSHELLKVSFFEIGALQQP